MAPSTPYFDLLDDDVAQRVIQSIPTNRGAYSWQDLAATCRRMCTLVRHSRRVSLWATPEGVQHLVKIPPHRAFSNLYALHLESRPEITLNEWLLYVEAAAAAAAAWPDLEQLSLQGVTTMDGDSCLLGSLSGVFLALRRAPALRRLQLDLLESSNLAYLPLLTQLTHLSLRSPGANSPSLSSGTAGRPLAAMTHLVSLQLQGLVSAPAGPCVLPPNITRLELQSSYWYGPSWLVQAWQCQQLRELHLDSPPENPTLVLEALAPHLQHLVKLSVPRSETARLVMQEQHLIKMVSSLLNRAGVVGEEQQQDWQLKVPLGCAQGIAWPDSYVVLPPPNMGGLPALQHLELEGWWLVLSSSGYWRALGACHQLVTLPEMHVSAPPPAGVTFPGVTRLEVTTRTSPGDTLTLLAAFPGLKELEMKVVPAEDAGDEAQVAGQAVVSQVTSASVVFFPPPDLPPPAHAACLAAYCSALWGALPGLQQLALEWPNTVALLPLLPAVSALQQLRALQLDSSYARAAISCGGAAVVEPQQVVQLVQGAGQLQALTVSMELAPGSSKDQLVLGLQGALPALRQLVALKRGERLAPATLAALRPRLVVR